MDRAAKASLVGLAAALIGLVGVTVVNAQTPAAGPGVSQAQAARTWTPPRTPWGDPDLQGIWPSTHMVGVPFERPSELGDRLLLSDAELAARQAQAARQQELDNERFSVSDVSAAVVAMGDVGGPTSPPPHWLERGQPSRQSSLIVTPKNGRLPPMTPEGSRRAASARSTYVMYTGFNNFEDLGPYDRCISRGLLGSMFPVVYNNGNQILQTPGYVVLRNEMIHETRIIPLDGRPHLSTAIKSYMGDSRGHWEGNTLVVETTNLNGKTGAQGNGNILPTSDAVVVTERFTRTGRDAIQYEVTVNDPKTWTSAWTAMFPLERDQNYQMFEYACHEGNYGMTNILSASRADERKAVSQPSR
jgi:hypothetical protein